ncbi:MAG: hypothetical protein RL701_21 [Pseudomonadota bacterium]|jgi:hypothetical protein
MPCEINQILATKCQACHGAVLAAGAPMPLVTIADLKAPGRTNKDARVIDLVLARVQDRARPMPPDLSQAVTPAEVASLKNWTDSGLPTGATCTGAANGGAGGQVGSAGGGAGTGPAAGGAGGVVDTSGDVDIEKCYELRAHGVSAPGDQTPYTVPSGEFYSGFIFKAPWTTPVQGLRFRHLPDNAKVLHHWLLYSESNTALPDGEVEACDLGGLTGFSCGIASTRSLITGWAPGRGDFRLPKEVGLELPAPGALLAVEFHYFNVGAAQTSDKSGVEVCVTSKFRPNTASVSWLGTNTINVAAHTQGTASGTCTPLRKGLNATDPIHVLFSWPHMHKLGRHMTSTVKRAGGANEMLYDGAFSFEYQVLYDTPLLLQPGDSVTTTCSYDNTTNGAITFGQSTAQEMCYNFAYAWPAHSLDNPGGVGSAANTCLH